MVRIKKEVDTCKNHYYFCNTGSINNCILCRMKMHLFKNTRWISGDLGCDYMLSCLIDRVAKEFY